MQKPFVVRAHLDGCFYGRESVHGDRHVRVGVAEGVDCLHDHRLLTRPLDSDADFVVDRTDVLPNDPNQPHEIGNCTLDGC